MNFYIDGVEVVDPSTGKTEKASSSCDSEEDNCAENGREYNWYAAYYACPTGQHLPSQEEWKTLIKTMGEDEASERLRSTVGWKELNRGIDINGTDDCGFTLLANDYTGYEAIFWTQSVNVSYSGEAREIVLASYTGKISWFSASKELEVKNIRCLKN